MVERGVDSTDKVHPILVDADGRPYVIVTDGTRILTLDGLSRLHTRVDLLRPDGTNTMPSGDTAARPIFTRLADGTNAIGTVKDEITGRTSLLTTRGHGKNTITVEYTANTAATALITPGAGNHLDICGVFTTSDSAAGDIALDFATTGTKVWRHYISRAATAVASEMHIEGAADEVLTVTTTQGNQDVFIIVNYRELA